MRQNTSTPPDFFTVEEAARVLRIGRGAAYTLARQWRATDGREGLPVISLGKTLRVPRAALERLCGGPLTVNGEPHAAEAHQKPRQPRRRRRLEQEGLPLES